MKKKNSKIVVIEQGFDSLATLQLTETQYCYEEGGKFTIPKCLLTIEDSTSEDVSVCMMDARQVGRLISQLSEMQRRMLEHVDLSQFPF